MLPLLMFLVLVSKVGGGPHTYSIEAKAKIMRVFELKPPSGPNEMHPFFFFAMWHLL